MDASVIWAGLAGVFLTVVVMLLVWQAFDVLAPVNSYRPDDDHLWRGDQRGL